ncbi:hypothetical protein INT44_006597 [Umbelopsis vinacea]|uniref:Uncharacterized protein n=1 Tax=Umbelopsis vinacea TaxID=44442 RepID=A0A8H7PUJ7_9FUNG|nr:hypothetical protein INT44_006597 [Umbelopsis vinacea]
MTSDTTASRSEDSKAQSLPPQKLGLTKEKVTASFVPAFSKTLSCCLKEPQQYGNWPYIRYASRDVNIREEFKNICIELICLHSEH